MPLPATHGHSIPYYLLARNTATMKGLAVATILAATSAFAMAATPKILEMPRGGLRADSTLGMKLLSQARRLEDNADDANEDNAGANEEEQENQVDMTWVKNFSIKFQGCHYVQQFSDQGREGQGGGEQANNAGVQVQRLVRFRLCPSNICNGKNSQGCNKKYGDYVVGLDTFVNAYYEYQQRSDEYECEMYLQNSCNCEDDGNQGDDFNAEYCEYDCFATAGMQNRCVDRNPYEEEEGQEGEGFDVERYMECAEWEYNQGEGGRRRRVEQNAAEDEGTGLFIGPYCSGQGGAIYLGAFLDEGCTEFADQKHGAATFELLSGMELPYSSENIIRSESCLSCQNNANWEDDGQNDEVADLCQQVYPSAGKCEQKLPSGTVAERNNNACAYIDGIQTVREDGIAKAKSGSAGTTFFIAFLILTCMGLGFYVYYLRRRQAIKSENIKSVLLQAETRNSFQSQPSDHDKYEIDDE